MRDGAVTPEAIAAGLIQTLAPARACLLGDREGRLADALRAGGVDVCTATDRVAAALDAAAPIASAGQGRRDGGDNSNADEPSDVVVCLNPAESLGDPTAGVVADLCRLGTDIVMDLTSDPGDALASQAASPDVWAERLAQHGYYRDLDFDGSWLGPSAARFVKSAARPTAPEFARLVRRYEDRLARTRAERDTWRRLAGESRHELAARDADLVDLRRRQEAMTMERFSLEEQLDEHALRVHDLEAQVSAWRGRWSGLESSPAWLTVQSLQDARRRYLPPGSRREAVFATAHGWLNIVRAHGVVGLARHLTRELRLRVVAARQAWWYRRARHGFTRLDVRPVAVRPLPSAHAEMVDIVICIHNALDDVRACLESVRRHTAQPYRLVLVDDGSDDATASFLSAYATADRGVARIRNDSALGYTRAANQGLLRSLPGAGNTRNSKDPESADSPPPDYIVLLNSDTVVTEGWLDRLVACAASDPKIGIVGPLSNSATWQSIPEVQAGDDWAENALDEDTSIDLMAELVAADSARLYPRAPFLNGFCLLVRRSLVAEIGGFDEATFGQGYGEENDFALRARAAGWQLAIADDAYVYHAQSKSYTHERRRPLVDAAGEALVGKHGAERVAEGVSILRDDKTLAGIRARTRFLTARHRLVQQGRDRYAGKRVLFVLPVASAVGGANIAMFEMRGMRAMGVDAAVFNLEEHRGLFERAYPDLDLPVVYGVETDLFGLAAEWDAMIATINSTVYWLAPIARGPEAAHTVFGYFIQDFEPYFSPPGSVGFYSALESYTHVPNMVRLTMTPWNGAELKRVAGVDSTVTMPGYDAALFRPRPRANGASKDRPLRIAGMVRPPSPWRSPRLTMEVFREVARRHGPHVELVVFGVEPDEKGFAELPADFPFRLTGRLDPRQMAELLADVDIFVDFSVYQAMGMTAIEAMACGSAVIITQYGGPDVFARHEENCLLVDTQSRDACIAALDRLIGDDDLRRRLVTNGIADACQYYPERAALNMLHALFGGAHAAPESDKDARAAGDHVDAAP